MSRARILPEGSEMVGADETVLWRGRPRLAGLVRNLFHIRIVLGYFFVLAAANLATTHAAGFRANAAFISTVWTVLPAVAAAAVIYAMAWVLVLTTRYTITDRRVIMEIGVAFPIGLTLPLHEISSANLRLYPDGTGDIPLAIGTNKIAYLLIWPHARPWRLKKPEPMLRAIPNAGEVANLLSRALVAVSPKGEAVRIEPTVRPELHGTSGTPGIAAA